MSLDEADKAAPCQTTGIPPKKFLAGSEGIYMEIRRYELRIRDVTSDLSPATVEFK